LKFLDIDSSLVNVYDSMLFDLRYKGIGFLSNIKLALNWKITKVTFNITLFFCYENSIKYKAKYMTICLFYSLNEV